MVRVEVEVTEPILFDFTLAVSVLRASDGVLVHRSHLQQDGWDVSWLPQGVYIIEWRLPRSLCVAGEYGLQLEAAQIPGGHYVPLCSVQRTLKIEGKTLGEQHISPPRWSLEKKGDSGGIGSLSWSKGKENWFYKHFDHAARVVIHYMFDDSPLLRGKILDVGCGEGITDLGICLRTKPSLLVGLDIERHFLQLPRMMRENGLPFSHLPENLVFCRGDANCLPFPDDSFDVVISWASLEHIVGEPRQVLQEIKRVLKDGGLFFLHPGLYYSSAGHHLGEFTPEPFVHLKKTSGELKNIVFTAEPRYMDRGGITYTPADFWRYYTELNKITVSDLEKDLRWLGFEFHKVAVRAEDLVTYTPELQKYSIQDLTTQEIYLALWNRKRVASWAGRDGEARGEGYPREKINRGGEGKQDFELWNTQPPESVCGVNRPDHRWSQALEQRCVEYFLGCQNVLDLSCGSGTLAKFLTEKGIRSVSLGWQRESEERLMRRGCTSAGGDVFEFLRRSSETFDGIFYSHCVERLSFIGILKLMDLLLPRLEREGILLIVLPSQELIGAYSPGFSRPAVNLFSSFRELIATTCVSYGLEVVRSRSQGEPPTLPPTRRVVTPESTWPAGEVQRGWLRRKFREPYVKLVRALRLVPKTDLVTLERRLSREIMALWEAIAPRVRGEVQATVTVNGDPNHNIIICRKAIGVRNEL